MGIARSHAGVLLTLAVFMLTGCAADRAYHRGRTWLRAEEYDKAIASFEEAVKEWPHKAEYHEALSMAKARGAVHHRKLARKHLSERRLASAKEHVEIALRFEPGHPGAGALLSQIDSLIAKARSKRQAAFAFQEKKLFRQAVEAMCQALELDKSLPNGKEDTSMRPIYRCRARCDGAKRVCGCRPVAQQERGRPPRIRRHCGADGSGEGAPGEESCRRRRSGAQRRPVGEGAAGLPLRERLHAGNGASGAYCGVRARDQTPDRLPRRLLQRDARPRD